MVYHLGADISKAKNIKLVFLVKLLIKVILNIII